MNREDLSLLAKGMAKATRTSVDKLIDPVVERIKSLEDRTAGQASSEILAQAIFRLEALERNTSTSVHRLQIAELNQKIETLGGMLATLAKQRAADAKTIAALVEKVSHGR